jgi:hypothetical protein
VKGIRQFKVSGLKFQAEGGFMQVALELTDFIISTAA